MSNIINRLKLVFDNNLLDRLLCSAIFAASFAVLGYYIPKTYLNYFDETEYYKIYSPISIENNTKHYACDKVDVIFIKESLIEGRGVANIALNLVKADSNNEKIRVSFQEEIVPITKGKSIITTSWKLPCDIKAGEYAFEGVLSYDVNNVKKTHLFYSEKFIISSKGK